MRVSSIVILSISLFCGACKSSKIEAPEPYGAVPTTQQLNWHKLEYYAFIHFNMNTFTDMEWGMGSEQPQWFNPTNLDVEQWVKVIKEAGMKGIILTAKHHDGFCLWQSAYTEHSVKNSPWRNGKGDLVKELSQACQRHGIKLGIYLSPWDRNHPDYGKQAYVTYFHNQLRELLTNYGEIFEVWFDGANGGTGYYGGANELRTIDAKTYYQWDKVKEIVRELQPQAVIFGDKMDIRWVGNERGVGGLISWSPINYWKTPQGMTHEEHLSRGDADGVEWIPSEVDVSIRPGWYYHTRENHQVKTLKQLVDIYYHSVGRNSSLLLNFPVDTRGQIHDIDAKQAIRLKETINSDFQEELAHKAKVEVSSIWKNSKKFAGSNVINSDETYWAPSETDSTPFLTITFDTPTQFNRVVLQEFIELGQRISQYTIQVRKAGGWHTIANGATIGYKTILRTESIETTAIRILIQKAQAVPLLRFVGVYNAPPLLVPPTISRDKEGNVTLSSAETDMQIYYTLNGDKPTKESTLYTKPFEVVTPVDIQVIAYDKKTNQYSDIQKQHLDIPKKHWKVIEISSGDLLKSESTIDNNPITEFYTAATGKNQFITIDLGKEYSLNGFTYLPAQSRWAYGTISHYEFHVSADGKNWKKVSYGEFSNIKNNPILQEKYFDTTTARYIKLISLNQVDNSNAAGFGEIGVLTQTN
ncbi:alpha-L-fucosidase [Capnocytophaga catalasegens]|uniref:alpha-L-fucosidase n=1 Tax=Capnocytophaga catalasegens TaxID=1004260 RepID=A0AAV5AXP2_9FLAO|nr:alpha-L-fucosidase [Capnocytophaga catalasegens]GIZ16093.1 hypothetical protein RCZ03_20930 [Capnocytophaga catalasegens]GJM50252.1 hypothetical protein RCZ15_12250 [Capnocytophaga catalasegens]GJM53483.1 hypothetical protein RCZ16_17990 [Capnocytophaga catalasegens]